MSQALNVRGIESLRPKDKSYTQRVDSGLYIRVSPAGEKRWLVRTSVSGKTQDFWLPKPYGNGSDGYLSLLQAKAESARIKSQAKLEIDERKRIRKEIDTRKREDETARRKNLTVQDLYDVWIKDGVNRKDSNSGLKRAFEKDVLPKVSKTLLKELSEQNIRKMYRDIIDRGVQRTAIVIARDFSQMLRWAEQRQPWRELLMDGNPANLVNVMDLVSHDYVHERDRVLTHAEIKELATIFTTTKAVYDAAENKRKARRPLSEESQCAVWICLSTLCRIGELLKAKWAHVDLEAGTWLIPAENTKGERGKKQDQTVTLSAFALNQFNALKKRTGESAWLFPASNGKTALNEKTVSKQIGDRQIMFKKRKELKNRVNDNSLVLSKGESGEWTPHDLRRTGATTMQELGVTMEVIDRCQNHVIAGSKVRRHYMKYDYLKEKADAWAKLGERLDLIVKQSNVAFLKTA